VTDYFVTQLTGSRCAGRNCAAATVAMIVAYGTNYAIRPTSDGIRSLSGASCVPGVHSPSGGLFISDDIRCARHYGVSQNWNLDVNGQAHAWPSEELARRCGPGLYEAAQVLGRYGSLPSTLRIGTFTGMHSMKVHNYHVGDDTFCVHDPLRKRPIRMKRKYVLAYWFGGSPKGLAGFTPWPSSAFRRMSRSGYIHSAATPSRSTRLTAIAAGEKVYVIARLTGATYTVDGVKHTSWLKVKRMKTGRVGYVGAAKTRS
jgi:hypothetical protein